MSFDADEVLHHTQAAVDLLDSDVGTHQPPSISSSAGAAIDFSAAPQVPFGGPLLSTERRTCSASDIRGLEYQTTLLSFLSKGKAVDIHGNPPDSTVAQQEPVPTPSKAVAVLQRAPSPGVTGGLGRVGSGVNLNRMASNLAAAAAAAASPSPPSAIGRTSSFAALSSAFASSPPPTGLPPLPASGDRPIRRIYSMPTMSVHCPNQLHGCTFSGSVDRQATHLLDCLFQVAACRYVCALGV